MASKLPRLVFVAVLALALRWLSTNLPALSFSAVLLALMAAMMAALWSANLAVWGKTGHVDAAMHAARPNIKEGPYACIFAGKHITNKDNLLIYYKMWAPKPAGTAPVVQIVHGFGEHIRRYDHVAAALNAAGFNVVGIDLCGHGRSEGDRAYLRHKNDFAEDVLQFRREVVPPLAGQQKVYLLGHSMGGLVSSQAMLLQPDLWHGLVLSGPPLEQAEFLKRPLKAIVAVLAKLLPKLVVFPVDASLVSRTKAVVVHYELDPLVLHNGGLTASLLNCLLLSHQEQHDKVADITWPLLLQYGTEDKIVDTTGLPRFFERIGSKDKVRHAYENTFHEIYNSFEACDDVQTDPDTKVVTNRAIRDLITWLQGQQAA